MVIVGIDCAVAYSRTGLALGIFESGRVRIEDIKIGSKSKPPAEIIIKWLPKDQPALLALDAPLGWPTLLSQELINHIAGNKLENEPNELFRRNTDRLVKAKTGKQSLDVGADRIARTAYSALELLNSLRKMTGLPIPLAWEMGSIKETCAIEVYPAATLWVRLKDIPNYKVKEQLKRD